MKVLFLPRGTSPYQECLAEGLQRHGVEVSFVPAPTVSHTINLLLIPAALLVSRLRGYTVLHVHWVYGFQLPGVEHWPWLRRPARAWFGFVLSTATAIGMRVVWTAHNLLPHTPVFPDDREARAELLSRSTAVIAHSPRALGDLQQEGWSLPPVRAVVRQGPVEAALSDASGDAIRDRLGIPRGGVSSVWSATSSFTKGCGSSSKRR